MFEYDGYFGCIIMVKEIIESEEANVSEND